MKTFFSNIAKTKKGKIQLLTMALSTLLAVVFTIILIVFGNQQICYNKKYTFDENFLSLKIHEEITLYEDNTYERSSIFSDMTSQSEGTFYIKEGNLFIKDTSKTEYSILGKISYYSIKVSRDGLTYNLDCNSTITAKNVCITFLVLSLVAIASMIAWIVIEKYLKNRKPATQNVVSTPTDNNEKETAVNEKAEKVEAPQEAKEETTNTDTSAKE